MKRALIVLAVLGLGAGLAYRYFQPDLPWVTDASSDGKNPIGDMDQPLPQTVLVSLDNHWVDLASYKGKVVLIEFFATWCPGCVDETPSLIRFQRKFGDKGFSVVAVAIDDQGDETVDSFVRNRQFSVDGAPASIDFPVLTGSEGIAQKLGFEGGLPAGVLVNRDGQEVKIIRGVVTEAALSKAIQRLVNK
jgi:thiol-disulfide isomerase/thioredoxin